MSDVFEALAHPVRRKILKLLRNGPLKAGDLADKFDIAQPTVSGHLAKLRAANLVVTEREGTSIVYGLNLSAIEEAATVLLSLADTYTESKSARSWKPATR